MKTRTIVTTTCQRIVCGQKEDDEEVEDWVACEACSQWIHAKCIPVDHPFSLEDPDFYCHNCIC